MSILKNAQKQTFKRYETKITTKQIPWITSRLHASDYCTEILIELYVEQVEEERGERENENAKNQRQKHSKRANKNGMKTEAK